MMTEKLEQAFQEAESLPAEDQDAIAEALMVAIHIDPKEEREWLQLVESDESQALLERMAGEVEAEITEGRKRII
jgi:hypothetical protein